MDARRRIDRIFLLHLWACAPFALLWLFVPAWRREQDPATVRGLQILCLVALLYLLARSWVVLRQPDPSRWAALWPICDTLLVAATIAVGRDQSGLIFFLYLLPIAYAALNLPLRQSLYVSALAVVSYLFTGTAGLPDHPYELLWLLFRLFFLVLMASLIGFLAREGARLREQLALAEYQREVSEEVHDGIQHYLVLIARQLELVDRLRERDPARAASLAAEQREVACRAADELRFMVRRLRRQAGSQPDLAELLRQSLDPLGRRGGLGIDVGWRGEPGSVPAARQHSLFRMVQEAVTNALKHARPQRVSVTLEQGAERLVVRVSDDGVGFDPAAVTPGEGGLETLRQRAAELGGECRVSSAPGKGTEVVIDLPAKT